MVNFIYNIFNILWWLRPTVMDLSIDVVRNYYKAQGVEEYGSDIKKNKLDEWIHADGSDDIRIWIGKYNQCLMY
ncbi:MAG: hypothetical protein N4A62_02560 [Marinisporobacter sp.]|jgi:3D (Asp-Asp-Asp) domain-containing protein|nr:hypothetical protein [Marinisporobacter sp.]